MLFTYYSPIHTPATLQSSLQAFKELIASGRLPPEQTDVSVYEVDGRVCLAEVFHGLRRHYYWTPSYGHDGGPATNAALALMTAETPTDLALSRALALVSDTEDQTVPPLQSS